MGTEIPDPPVIPPVAPGTACPLCWGSNNYFGPGETPSSLMIRFSGIEKGPNWNISDGEPPNRDYIVVQSSLYPCQFVLGSIDVVINLTYGHVQSSLALETPSGVFAFVQNHAYICAEIFYNQYVNQFQGGTGLVMPPDIIS